MDEAARKGEEEQMLALAGAGVLDEECFVGGQVRPFLLDFEDG